MNAKLNMLRAQGAQASASAAHMIAPTPITPQAPVMANSVLDSTPMNQSILAMKRSSSPFAAAAGALLLLALVLSLSTTQQAQAQVGLTSAPFLRIEPDGRGAALGGAGVTLLDGGFGGYYNPASLGWQRGIIAGFSYSNWLSGITSDMRYNRFAGSYELDDRSTIAASLSYVNLGQQMATDAQNNQLGTFFNYQMATGLSYGRKVADRLALGVGLKHIYSSLGAGQSVESQGLDPASTLALDAGLLWRSRPWSLAGRAAELRLGAALANVGPGLRYMDGQDRISLPQSFRAGAALELALDASGDHSLTLSGDVSRLLARMERSVVAGDTSWSSMAPIKALVKGWGPLERFNGQEMVRLGFAEQFGLSLGAEYWFRGLFALRGGYYGENPDNGDRRYVSAGAGLRYMGAEIDFSWLSSIEQDHPLDGTMRLSLRLHLGGGYKAPRQVTERAVGTAPAAPALAYAEPAPMPEPTPDPTPEPQPEPQPTPAPQPAPEIPPAPITAPSPQAVEEFDALAENPVAFASMSSQIEHFNAEVVAKVVVALQRYGELELTIEGYTDAQGSAALNTMLSEARARALALEILSYGVIAPQRLAIQGLADADSVASNATEAGRQANRRGQFSLSMASANASNLSNSLATPPAWLSLEDRRALIEFADVNPTTPLNQGTELAFTWLEPTEPDQARLWLRSLAAHLEQNPEQDLSIAAYVSYAGSSQAFLTELAKARVEKLKALLISIGVEQGRITILSPQGPTAPAWQQAIEPILPQGNAERVWFILD